MATTDSKADTEDMKVSTATSSKGDAQGSMDGRLTNPEDVQDDVPMNKKKSKNSGQRESEARKGFKKASGTPLPDEDVDASDDEDKAVGKIKAREVQPDGDSEAEDDEDSDDDDMPEGMTKASWKVWKIRIKDIESREKAIEDLETFAEGRAVGKAEASGTVQSSKRLPEKTPMKRKVKAGDEAEEISPIIKKFIDEEVEKRLKEIVPKKEALVTRLFHDDEEDEAQRQLEESMEMMKKADEKVRKIQADKEAAQRRLIQEKIKEKLEQQAFEESQRRKRLMMEEKHKEMIKKKNKKFKYFEKSMNKDSKFCREKSLKKR